MGCSASPSAAGSCRYARSSASQCMKPSAPTVADLGTSAPGDSAADSRSAAPTGAPRSRETSAARFAVAADNWSSVPMISATRPIGSAAKVITDGIAPAEIRC